MTDLPLNPTEEALSVTLEQLGPTTGLHSPDRLAEILFDTLVNRELDVMDIAVLLRSAVEQVLIANRVPNVPHMTLELIDAVTMALLSDCLVLPLR